MRGSRPARRLGVDREAEEVAQVDAALEALLGRRMRLELDARAAFDEQTLEHVLDPSRRPEVPLDLCAPASGADDGEIARVDVHDPLRVEHDRHARREEGLAADQLAAPFDLDDDVPGWDELGHCVVSLRSSYPLAVRERRESARSWHSDGTDT